METERIHTEALSQDAYPGNLLIAIEGDTGREIPAKLTDDNYAGLQYALSTLEERERMILVERYGEGKVRAEIGGAIGISRERVRQIETKAIRKLRGVRNWRFITLGVAGYFKRIATSEYNKGYSSGYQKGYEDGAADTAKGMSKIFDSYPVMRRPIESLNLSIWAHNCLIAAQCTTVGDVARLSEEKISTMRNFGKISADEVARAITGLGIQYTAWDRHLL